MADLHDRPVRPVISAIFQALDERGIPFAVLRNHATLPDSPAGGSDIDLLIGGEDREAYNRCVENAAASAGWKIFHERVRLGFSSVLLYPQECGWPPLKVDTFGPYTWRGIVWVEGSRLLRERIKNDKGIWILRPGAEAAILFAKEPLAGFPIKPKYQERIQILAAEDPEGFRATLSPFFGEQCAEEMFQTCLTGQWEEAFARRNRWRRSLVAGALRREPLHQCGRWWLFLWGHLCDRLRFQRGVLVALVGPDGAGKTTICRELSKTLQNHFLGKIHMYHGRFAFLPELKTYYKFLFAWRPAVHRSPRTETMEVGKLRAFLHVAYYGLEFFLSWPWVLWAKRRGYVLLFDRYFYDFIIQQNHRRFCQKLVPSLSKVLPRPDVVVVLSATPARIHERKPELAPEEIENQLAACRELQHLLDARVIFVDTQQALDKSVTEVGREFVAVLAR